MPYQITEPHPTASPNAYMHTGRGGAGNMYKVTATASVSNPLAKTTTSTSTRSSSHPSAKVSTGRGGAANIRSSSQIHNFSFEEEVALQARDAHHEVWHVGRGGAGNWGSKEPVQSSRKLSNESEGSDSSQRSGFFGRLSGAFDRN